MDTPRRASRNLHLDNVQQLSTPLRIPPSPFMKKIGYGTGVEVWKLERGYQQSPWAVKKIASHFRAKAAEEDTELLSNRIQEEAAILRQLSHPNIVGYRGVATTVAGGVDSLALECCNDSLGAILEERYEAGGGPLTAHRTLRMIMDVTRGLDYLHTEVRLLHGDLKSYNILVKGDFEICKLCDFGVSLQMDENGEIDFAKHPEVHYVGTNIWSAPEIIDECTVIDCKADIFSFGLVVYETIALVPPHTLDLNAMDSSNDENATINSSAPNNDSSKLSCECEEGAAYVDDSALMSAVENAYGTRPPLPQAFDLSNDYNIIVEVFYLCTDALPENRPMAAGIWKNLEMPAD